MRWVFLDEILEIRKGQYSRVRGHIPWTSVSPECLVTEMMAQAGGLLLGLESDFRDNLVFAKIETMDFMLPLEPGDSLEIEASSESLKPEGSWISVKAAHGGRIAAEGALLLMNAGSLVPGRENSVTFHEAFMEHYRPREKVKS